MQFICDGRLASWQSVVACLQALQSARAYGFGYITFLLSRANALSVGQLISDMDLEDVTEIHTDISDEIVRNGMLKPDEIRHRLVNALAQTGNSS